MRIILSSKQYTMLQLVLKQGTFSQEDAATYLQPTFGSMAQRGYLSADVENGAVVFKVTPAAHAAMAQYKNDVVFRTIESSSLSKWLDGYVKRSQSKRTRGAA